MIAAAVLAATGCRQAPADNSDDADMLVSVDGDRLTMQEVLSRIPVGIDASDSIALFREIVDSWLETRVIADLAESNLPDIEEIDRKVADYRNRLIVTEYLRRMKDGKTFRTSEDSVKAFYSLHHKELLTEAPLVKGVYIKVDDRLQGLDELRRLMTSLSDESIDRIEKEYVGSALQYDYFEGNWVDWQVIADQIPYRFYDPDAFLSTTKDFETSYNGSTYLLHVSEYLPTGSEQPFEFASPRIAALMEQKSISSYEDALVKALIAKAVKDGRLVMGNYDPLNHALISGRNDEKKKQQRQ